MTAVETNNLENLAHKLNGSQSISMVEDAKYLPIFPKATRLLFNSGNVVSSDRLKKRTNLNPEEELLEVINNTLVTWLNSVDKNELRERKLIECRHPEFYEKLNESEKSDISISVKLFLNTFDPEELNKSITKILEEIGADVIDTLILSLPEKIFNRDELPRDLLLPLWSVVQQNVRNKRVLTAGLCDFNAKNLEQLLNALEDKNQKPTINQVNTTSCCKMPEELVEFAKINNIQLTTHIDPKEILTAENLESNLRKNTHQYDSHGWMHNWIARYTLLLKGRGILKSKGYIINAQRELRYTKV